MHRIHCIVDAWRKKFGAAPQCCPPQSGIAAQARGSGAGKLRGVEAHLPSSPSSPTATDSDTLTTRNACKKRANLTNVDSTSPHSYFVPQAHSLLGTSQIHNTIKSLYPPIPGTAMVRLCASGITPLVMRTVGGRGRRDGPRADHISTFFFYFSCFSLSHSMP